LLGVVVAVETRHKVTLVGAVALVNSFINQIFQFLVLFQYRSDPVERVKLPKHHHLGLLPLLGAIHHLGR
jgi:hypothetical protein